MCGVGDYASALGLCAAPIRRTLHGQTTAFACSNQKLARSPVTGFLISDGQRLVVSGDYG